MNAPEPPDHVVATFGLSGTEPIALTREWEGGWRIGEVVLSLVPDHARAAWSAKVREDLFVDGLRVARPLRGTDGRYVVSGWRADTYIAGSPEPRHDEVVSVANRLHQVTAAIERPRFLLQPARPPYTDVDVFTAADRAAWEDAPLRSARAAGFREPTSPDGVRSIEMLKTLSTLRQPVSSPSQLVHGDLFGTVLFAGAAAPASPTSSPTGVPRLGRGRRRGGRPGVGGADDDLVTRWSDLPEWPQWMLRALLFRLAVHSLHPRSSAGALAGLSRVVDIVRLMV